MRGPEVGMLAILCDGELPHAGIGLVLNAWIRVGVPVIEIGVKQMGRSPRDGHLACTRFHRDVHGLSVVTYDGAALMVNCVIAATVARKRTAMPEQSNQNEHESQNRDGGTHRGTR